jgi:hypothetical protein
VNEIELKLVGVRPPPQFSLREEKLPLNLENCLTLVSPVSTEGIFFLDKPW